MTKRSANTNYNTNLASEYYIMSLLCRLGIDAYLSLGNKKGVDILVKTPKDNICVLEVKGVNKNNDWLICNTGSFPAASNLFYALVGFEGNIDNVNAPVKFYIIPSDVLSLKDKHKISKNEKTVYLSHKYITQNYSAYLNSFKYLDDYLLEH